MAAVKVDPRAKIVTTVLLIVGVMTLPWGIPLWSCAFLAFIALILIKPPFRRLASAPLALSWMLVITILVHGFSSSGHVLWEMPVTQWRLTTEGLLRGLLFSGRLAGVMVLGAGVSLSIGPLEGIRALEDLGKPLAKLKIPVSTFTLVLGLALRFVPTLFEEALVLRKAQTARGWTPGKGVVQSVRAWVPLFIPVLASGLRRSDEIAETLLLRGYHPQARRVSMNPGQWRGIDSVLVVASLLPWAYWIVRVSL